MIKTLLILAALFAIAHSDNVCLKSQCNGLNGNCGSGYYDSNTFTELVCKDNLACALTTGGNNTGTCQTVPKLQQSCSNVGCDETSYTLLCTSGTCLYAPAYGPGDSCTAATIANYGSQNPCTTTCSSTCSGTVVADGGICDDVTKVCNGQTQYCAFGKGTNGTNVCQNRLAAGASCAGTTQCGWNLFCGSRVNNNLTCVTPFTQTAGQSCAVLEDCAAGLFCSSGTCNSPTAQNTACTRPDQSIQGTCLSGYACVCNGGTGTIKGKCEAAFYSKTEVSDYLAYISCVSTSCNFDLDLPYLPTHTAVTVNYVPDSCPVQKCSSKVKDLISSFTSNSGSCGSSAVAISAFAFLLIALVSAVLMF